MGTIKQGILGGFSGKVGTVVGASWKGKAYMRGMPQHYTTQATWGTLFCQRALSAIIEVLRPIASTLRLTFGDYDHGMSTFNKAVKINYPGAIENHDGEPVVIYKKLQLSKGFLQCFDMFAIDDPAENGHWFVGAIQYDNSEVEYPGFILILYDKTSDTWFSHVYDQPFTTGTSLTMQGFPINSDKDLLGWVFVYDKSLGQVSNNCLDFHSMHINEDDE